MREGNNKVNYDYIYEPYTKYAPELSGLKAAAERDKQVLDILLANMESDKLDPFEMLEKITSVYDDILMTAISERASGN